MEEEYELFGYDRATLIALSNGGFAIVDLGDFEELIKINWWAKKSKKSSIRYVEGWDKSTTKKVLMHRFIVKPETQNVLVDHINHNGLDNRRVNLRSCSASENQRNNSSHRQSSSKYKGVAWNKIRGKWQAYINTPKRVNLGMFQQEEEAAKAYDSAAILYHKDFANLNFKPNGRGI